MKQKLEALMKKFSGLEDFLQEAPRMSPKLTAQDGYEISPRFRTTLEQRISRLERDAATDESQLAFLVDPGHIKRHMRLVALQRSEALRLRIFLDKSIERMPRPMIAL